MTYQQIYCWPHNSDGDALAREFFDKAKAGIDDLRLPEDAAFCLVRHTFTLGSEVRQRQIVVVLVQTLNRLWAFVEQHQDLATLGLDVFRELVDKAMVPYTAEMKEKIDRYFVRCGCPEHQTENIELGEDYATVDNLAARIIEPWRSHHGLFVSMATVDNLAARIIFPQVLALGEASWTVIDGPVVKRIRSQEFRARSMEEVKATAAATIPANRLLDVRKKQLPRETFVEAQGSSAALAIAAAKALVPAGSYDIGIGEITQKGRTWLLGSSPFKVRVAFRSPAVATARFYEVILEPRAT
jgi:hypothetical protein